MRCIRCKRTLTREPVAGMGPTCYSKYGKPSAPTDRDLFGFNPAAAAAAASERIRIHVEAMAVEASLAIRAQFGQVRRKLGIWS